MTKTTNTLAPTYFENGDRLTREEFHRIYEQMPGVKAELINGVVHIHATYDAIRETFVSSPVRAANHAEPHSFASSWLAFYVLETPGVRFGDNATLKLPHSENEPQPDLYLRILPECGGQCAVGDDGYIEGPPELIIEVASSSKAVDLGPKKRAYRINGVNEYVVWRVGDDDLDWFVLDGDEYVCLDAVEGVIRSRMFPGLWLDVNGLLSNDLRAVYDTVRRGTATAEHAEFVAKLAAAKANS